MISREIFIKTMEDIVKHNEFQNKLNDALSSYCDDGHIYDFRLEQSIVNLLKDLFNDNDKEFSILEYALWELDLLKEAEKFEFTNEKGEIIDDFGKLYDYLRCCMIASK